jgi:DhnA family fructose-bisphosphate aldolase class Ia
MDHSKLGVVPGLEDYLSTLQKVSKGGADAVLINYGNLLRFAQEMPRSLGMIMSLMDPYEAAQVETAARVGAEGVKFTHFGSITNREILKVLHGIGSECERLGIVFLAEIVPQDENKKTIVEQVASAARMGMESGADFIKTAYTGSVESFREVTKSCPIPVTILGGPKMNNDREILETVKGMVDAGGAGVSFGRNIFQHSDPIAMTRAIHTILHEKGSVEEALLVLKQSTR